MTYSGFVRGDDISANYFWYEKGKFDKPEQVKWFKGSVKKQYNKIIIIKAGPEAVLPSYLQTPTNRQLT